MTLYLKDMVLSIHLQKKIGQLAVFVRPPQIFENLAFGQIGQYVQIFKLVPQAQFSANHPIFFRPH